MKLNVSYHQQDQKGQDSYCGAASAQMVLHAIGAALFDQEALFKTSHETKDNITWHSAPDGLCSTLEAHKPHGFDVTFTMWPISSVEAMSRKVCWSLFEHKLPPVVLHNGCHWVVVTGFEASDEPKGPDDLSYQILKFYVHNPEPATSSDPPPHTSIDVDHQDDHCRERGTADEEIEYSDWVRTRSCLAGKWEDTFSSFAILTSPRPYQVLYVKPWATESKGLPKSDRVPIEGSSMPTFPCQASRRMRRMNCRTSDTLLNGKISIHRSTTTSFHSGTQTERFLSWSA